MVAHTIAKFLLASYVVGTAAQVPTIVARPVDDYKLSDGPKPKGSDIVAEKHEDEIRIFMGPDRASSLRKAVDSDCKTIDAKCLQSAQKALGMVPEEDGLNKRIAPILVTAGTVAVGIGLAMDVLVVGAVLGIVYLLSTVPEYDATKLKVPTPSDSDKEATTAATAVAWKANKDVKLTTIAISNSPEPTSIPKIEEGSSGSAITFPPGNMQLWASAAEQTICKRSLTTREVNDCLQLQTEAAVLAALASAGTAGMEIIHLTHQYRVTQNEQVQRMINTVRSYAQTIKTVYNELEIESLVEIITIYIWETFSDEKKTDADLAIIDKDKNRITLKKGQVDKVSGQVCPTNKFNPEKDLPGFDVLYKEIAVAIFKDPDWEDDGIYAAYCPKPDGNFPDPSLPVDDVKKNIKDFCRKNHGFQLNNEPHYALYNQGTFSAWLSVKTADSEECKEQPKLSQAACVEFFETSVDQCAKSNKIYGSDFSRNCISYSIITNAGHDEKDPPWNPKPKPECAGDVTNVRSNFLRGLWPAFCKDIDDQWKRVTLTNEDFQSPSRRKRSPPPSNSDNPEYAFEFSWGGGWGCRMDCNEAFEKITGACGSVAMYSEGKVNAGCGKHDGNYSIKIVKRVYVDKDCPEMQPGMEEHDWDAWVARNQCKDVCPDGKFSDCIGPDKTSACTCDNEVCRKAARGLCYGSLSS